MIFTFTTVQFAMTLGFVIIVTVVAVTVAMLPAQEYKESLEKRLKVLEDSYAERKEHDALLTEQFNDQYELNKLTVSLLKESIGRRPSIRTYNSYGKRNFRKDGSAPSDEQ